MELVLKVIARLKMAFEDPVFFKWIGSISAVLALPFVWIFHRQNRIEDAHAKLAEAVVDITTCAAKMEVHQKYIREDIEELKEVAHQRREDYAKHEPNP